MYMNLSCMIVPATRIELITEDDGSSFIALQQTLVISVILTKEKTEHTCD